MKELSVTFCLAIFALLALGIWHWFNGDTQKMLISFACGGWAITGFVDGALWRERVNRRAKK